MSLPVARQLRPLNWPLLATARFWEFRIPVIVFVVLALFFGVMLKRTAFGFNVYMLGTNPTAALFSGIDSVRVLLRTYWLAGVVAGIAGIIFLARANSAKPDYGASFILLTVLIAILGGVSYTGGFGTVSGLVLAVLTIQFLSTGLNMLMLELVRFQCSHLLPPVRMGRPALAGHGCELLRRAATTETDKLNRR